MTHDLVVRIATADDLPTLLPLMVDFNRLEGIAWTPAGGTDALRRLLGASELGVVGLAERSGSPCGYFVLAWGYDLEWNGRDAVLTELYIAPESRAQGFGRTLLAAADSTARAHGAHAMHLLVRPENAGALALYLRAGFRASPRKFLTRRLDPP
jgi:ribosomal protein S18 acetylase RimI-like enzyme